MIKCKLKKLDEPYINSLDEELDVFVVIESNTPYIKVYDVIFDYKDRTTIKFIETMLSNIEKEYVNDKTLMYKDITKLVYRLGNDEYESSEAFKSLSLNKRTFLIKLWRNLKINKII